MDLKFAEYTSYHELKTALAVGRIDAFSADKSILLGYKDDDSVILDDIVCKQEYGMACKLEDKDFCDYLDKVINKMKIEGTLRDLLKKWNLEAGYF
jgi:putative glutamine transport system substrate-binding protein